MATEGDLSTGSRTMANRGELAPRTEWSIADAAFIEFSTT